MKALSPTKFKILLATAGFLFFGNSAWALDSDVEYHETLSMPHMELAISGGAALQTGYLTQKDSVATYIVALNYGLRNGFFSFEWQGFKADHDTNEFALKNNNSVSVLTFSLIPHVRVWECNAWSAYLGLGLTQVTLAQDNPEYNFTAGTFTFAGQVRYVLSPKWSLHYKTQWYNVKQTVADQKTSFEVWNHAVGAGYSFF